MYSPGNAFVVYDIKRQVCPARYEQWFSKHSLKICTNLSNGSVPCDNTLRIPSSLIVINLDGAWLRLKPNLQRLCSWCGGHYIEKSSNKEEKNWRISELVSVHTQDERICRKPQDLSTSFRSVATLILDEINHCSRFKHQVSLESVNSIIWSRGDLTTRKIMSRGVGNLMKLVDSLSLTNRSIVLRCHSTLYEWCLWKLSLIALSHVDAADVPAFVLGKTLPSTRYSTVFMYVHTCTIRSTPAPY